MLNNGQEIAAREGARCDVYAKAQTHMQSGRPGDGSASVPEVMHPSDLIRTLADPTVPARAHDLQWPHATPPKSAAYEQLEAKAEQIRRRNLRFEMAAARD
jgi:hypothetical protein